MGNILQKSTAWQKPEKVSAMFGDWIIHDFHQGSSSTTVTPDVTDREIWLPVINKKLDKIRDKKQIDIYNKPDEASNGEPLLHASAPEGHIAANSVKPHPGLYKTQSHLALKKLLNQDQNTNYNKNFKKTKNIRKPTKITKRPKPSISTRTLTWIC